MKNAKKEQPEDAKRQETGNKNNSGNKEKDITNSQGSGKKGNPQSNQPPYPTEEEEETEKNRPETNIPDDDNDMTRTGESSEKRNKPM